LKITVNPDKEYVKKVREKIKANNGYCPCTLIKDSDHKCPCREFRENKNCHCGLYISQE